MKTPAIMTGNELAKELSVPYNQLIAWTNEGLIPVIRTGGRLFFNVGAVIKALRKDRESSQTLEESAA